MKRAYVLAGSATAALLVVGCASGAPADDPAAKTAGTKPAASANPGASATRAARPPEPSDFSLSVKTTKKQCFGSAGCNVEFHIEVTAPPALQSDDHLYTVTYEVSGVDDGPQVNHFTIRGLRYDRDDTESASTSTSRAKLTAKVTDVEQTG